jgi:hypothetical protein
VPQQKNCRGIAEANSKIIKRLRQLFAEAKIVEFRGLKLKQKLLLLIYRNGKLLRLVQGMVFTLWSNRAFSVPMSLLQIYISSILKKVWAK